jgi:hypothetical protein
MKKVKRICVVSLFAFKNFVIGGLFTGIGLNCGYDKLAAENYYFSSKNGRDSNNGTSASSPWQTINKVNQLVPQLKAGDIVYFERGSEWENAAIDIQNLYGSKSKKIKFTSYGTGTKPCFKGSKAVSSFDQSGNIWHKNESGLPVYDPSSAIRAIPFVYINGKSYDCSRYPNTGYLRTNTTDTKNNLFDATQSWSADYWKNGLIAVRNVNWRWATRKINSNNSSSLYFDDMDRDYERENTAYLIRNHVNACDQNGEWAQQNESLWIYWNGNLNAKKVEVPVVQTIFNINNSSYLVFEDLQIERAVVYGMHISGSILDIINCTISDAGGMLVYAEDHSVIATTGSSFTGGKRGGVFYDYSQGTVSHNSFKHMYFDGVDNTEHTFGACIASWHSDGKFYSEYNRMDSINLGYNMHWSNDSVWIQRNYITNFGFTVRDAAAIYFGSDFTGPAQGSTKFVNNNIVINAINDFIHGIYIDSNSNYVNCDSNTIENTNVAVFIHVSHDNSIRNTNIVNPAKDMTAYAWNQAIRLDEYSFKYGGEGTAVRYNEVTDNTVVLGETQDETAVYLLNITEERSNNFNRNTYFDPFGTDKVLFGIGQDYSKYNFFTLPEWQERTGSDVSSKVNKSNYLYNSNLGIPKSKFVKLVVNPTNQTVRYDLRGFDANYVDISGESVGDYVTIAPYYSAILFYKSARIPSTPDPNIPPDPDPNLPSNIAPVLNDQFFNLDQGMNEGSIIGSLIASDQNSEQQLSYTITSGNEDNLFELDPLLAELTLNFTPDTATDIQYVLGVTISDNGSPAMSDNAVVKINQAVKTNKVYIDPGNANDPLEQGSIEHPYDSWNDVTWTAGNAYLQKRNTVAEVQKINIPVSSVSIGSYGEGELPVIHSAANDFVFTIFEKNNITFSDLSIENESAVSLIYFLGSSCDNNLVERCKFNGGENGIRIMDGMSFEIRYNSFSNHGEAIYSFAQNTKLYYNVFHDNQAAIDINSNHSNIEIYNNVFYNNLQAVVASYANMILYNNIFYMTNKGDKAINTKSEQFVSDYNIFFPQRDGFISIRDNLFNNLTEYQQLQNSDINSFSNDPLFIDAPGDNFNLKVYSPAIDAGKFLMGLKKDFTGLNVPEGNAPDIGASENTASNSLAPAFQESMEVFPNPSNGEFEVSCQLLNPVDAIMDIFDLYGKKIISEVIPSNDSGELRHRVDISNVTSGMYVIKVVLESKILSSILIVN